MTKRKSTPRKPTQGQTRAYAQNFMTEDGVLEIDDSAIVSRADDPDDDAGGAYVTAWLWVPDDVVLARGGR